MNVPKDLFYTKNHEWVRIDKETITIGITDYAQCELGDIIFIELPETGTIYNSGDSVGTIEAVKTVADIFTPLYGEIAGINTTLEEKPEAINKDPYNTGWLIKLCNYENNDSKLLSPSAYKDLIA